MQIDVIFAIIGFIVSLLVGWFWSAYFYKTAKDDAEKESKRLNEKLDEKDRDLKEFIEKHMEEVKDLVASKSINETEENLKNIIKTTKKASKKLEIEIDTSILENTFICHTCGEIMFQSGFKPTQSGYIMHYRCPNGHEIQGSSLDDIMDD